MNDEELAAWQRLDVGWRRQIVAASIAPTFVATPHQVALRQDFPRWLPARCVRRRGWAEIPYQWTGRRWMHGVIELH